MQARLVRGHAVLRASGYSLAYLALVAGAAFAQDAGTASGPLLTLEDMLAHAEKHSPLMRAELAKSALGDAALIGARPALHDNPELEVGAGPRKGAGEDAA